MLNCFIVAAIKMVAMPSGHVHDLHEAIAILMLIPLPANGIG